MLLVTVLVAVFGVLPAFLVGALGTELRAELGVSPSQLGLAVSVLFGISAVASRSAGRRVTLRGARAGLVTALSLSALALLGLSLAQSYAWVVLALAVAGLGNSLVQPAANQTLSQSLGPHRLGLPMGIKQASIPAATLVGGLAVPAAAALVDWRWVAAALAVGAGSLAVWYGRGVDDADGAPGPRPERTIVATRTGPGLVVLSVGGALAMASCTSLGVFLITSAEATDLSINQTALVLAGCSVLGIAARIGLGALADRFGKEQLPLIGVMLVFSIAGYGLLTSESGVLFAVGSVVAYLAGFSWNGLFHYSVVLLHPGQAAPTTALVQIGLSFGAATGPLLYGLVVDFWSYSTAWWASGIVSLLGGVVILIGRHLISRERR